jgi:hypothetical protein
VNFYPGLANLETGAKFVYPLPAAQRDPARARQRQRPGQWRAVTDVNTTGLRNGVSGGYRRVQAASTQDYSSNSSHRAKIAW